jgi:hypothetical protein
MRRAYLSLFGALALPAYAQSSADRQGCITAAQKEFMETVEDIIKTAVPNPKYGSGVNDYLNGPAPKAFALCINWDLARPDSQMTRAWGFATRRKASGRKAVDSLAISNCAQGQIERNEKCSCEIVSRDGVTAIAFPKDWSGGRCK